MALNRCRDAYPGRPGRNVTAATSTRFRAHATRCAQPVRSLLRYTSKLFADSAQQLCVERTPAATVQAEPTMCSLPSVVSRIGRGLPRRADLSWRLPLWCSDGDWLPHALSQKASDQDLHTDAFSAIISRQARTAVLEATRPGSTVKTHGTGEVEWRTIAEHDGV